MDMDRFVNLQNIERYRQLASGTLTEAERRKIILLFSEEEAEYRESVKGQGRARSARVYNAVVKE